MPMPAGLVRITRNYITTRLGGRLLDVDYDFSFDPATCALTFLGATPTSTGYTIGGTGPTWVTTVRQFDAATVECETPANTCKKTISLHLTIRETWNLTVPLVGAFTVRTSRIIADKRLRFATQCSEKCCN